MKLISFLLFFSLQQALSAPVLEFMDLQAHATMSYPYTMFGGSLREASEEEISKLSYKHQFNNVVYGNLLAHNPGVRIFINGSLAFEYAKDKEKIKKILLTQIKAVNEYAAKNSSKFVVATSPHEARKLIAETNKTVILHSIEGGNSIINSQEDAYFWASQGVAFITLIHLMDDEYGGAAQDTNFLAKVLNLKGSMKKMFHPAKYRGLTEHGRNAIRWMAKAGIMTDMSHMSPQSVTDSIQVLSELNLPPLATHSLFEPVTHNDRGVTKKQMTEIYRLGGLFSLPISGYSVLPSDPDKSFLNFIAHEKICEASVDSYRVSFQFTENYILENLAKKKWNDLSEEEKIQYSMGWQSDWNGWLNHSRPRFGKKGCFPIPSGTELSEIETKGLAHPGLLAEYWSLLEKEGMNVESLRYSSEKFLRMWEKFENYRNSK